MGGGVAAKTDYQFETAEPLHNTVVPNDYYQRCLSTFTTKRLGNMPGFEGRVLSRACTSPSQLLSGGDRPSTTSVCLPAYPAGSGHSPKSQYL